MSTLHLIKAPLSGTTFERLLGSVQRGDALLLLSDGVYLALSATASDILLGALSDRCAVHILQPDLERRAVALRDFDERIEPVGYAGFVHLAGTCERSLWWG